MKDIFVLGISAFYHDSAASLIKNGQIVAAAHEERFSRIKHDPSFPVRAINYCLEEARISLSDIDAIVYYDNPMITLERMLANQVNIYPKGEDLWRKIMPRWTNTKLVIPEIIKNLFDEDFSRDIIFTEHHLSHASSAFYPSPFEEACILTIDGVGEWCTASIAHGAKNEINMLHQLEYPNSLGLLYSAFTYYTGFVVNRGEYKLMGLAPYGEPKYVDLITENLVDIRADGSIGLNLDFFGFHDSMKMTNTKFNSLFGGPPRQPESEITQKQMDLAKSIQVVTEQIVLKMAKHAHDLTGSKFLCLAGGVALNCVSNGRLLREGPFEDIWIQPAAGDAGGSLGAALAWYYHNFEKSREIGIEEKSIQRGSYWGPSFSNDEIDAYLLSNSSRWGDMYDYRKVSSGERAHIVANYLSENKIVGHFSGRMEFGPRALGARSILGNPMNVNTQSVMNLKIKYRESFRPFAPTVLEEEVSEYFEIDNPSPYMLLVARVQKEQCVVSPKNLDIIEWVNQKRSHIPAVTHVDYSARVQTINKKAHSNYYDIIKEFSKLTGCSVIVNTSFNVRGEPIVCNPHEAVNCFMNTEIDVLVIEDYVVTKNSNYIKPDKNIVKGDLGKTLGHSRNQNRQLNKLFNKHLKNVSEKITNKFVGGFNCERLPSFWSKYDSDMLYYKWTKESASNNDAQVEDILSHWSRFNSVDKKLFIPLLKDLILLTHISKDEDLQPLVLDEDIYTMF